jgi:zeta-carotene desaturase
VSSCATRFCLEKKTETFRPALHDMTKRPRVLVVGGGVAGMAAACSLADACEVTLLEKRPFLGGRVYSVRDARMDCEVDNAQHVFLGCFERLRGFLEKLGLQAHLQETFRLRLFTPQGQVVFRAAPLRAPLHLAPALFRLKPLSWPERLALARSMDRIRRMGEDEVRGFEGKNFGEWLRSAGQSPAAVTYFWDFFALAALNAHVDRADAADAFFVFRKGLLESRKFSAVGYLLRGQEAVGRAARAYVESRGGRVLTERGAAALQLERSRVAAVQDDTGERHTADVYILALPPAELYALTPPSLRSLKPFSHLPSLGGSPIVGVHLWYDRPVVDFDFAGFPGHRLQWVFNKSRIFGIPPRGPQYLSIVLSSAREWIDAPKESAVQAMDEAIKEWFPEARRAALVHSRVIKEPAATLLPFPGYHRLRPAPRAGVPNLLLAGEWTATGWPSSMESAVRSGEACARLVLEQGV